MTQKQTVIAGASAGPFFAMSLCGAYLYADQKTPAAAEEARATALAEAATAAEEAKKVADEAAAAAAKEADAKAASLEAAVAKKESEARAAATRAANAEAARAEAADEAAYAAWYAESKACQDAAFLAYDQVWTYACNSIGYHQDCTLDRDMAAIADDFYAEELAKCY